MFEFEKILEFLSQNTDWINWAAFILVFMESLIAGTQRPLILEEGFNR